MFREGEKMKRAGTVVVVFFVLLPCWAYSYIYTVQKGDTPESILRKSCYRLEDVAGTNLTHSFENLRAGDVVELPFLKPSAVEVLKTKLTDMGRIISEKTQAHDELAKLFNNLKAESARHELENKELAREASTVGRYRLGFVGGFLVALASSVFAIYVLRKNAFYVKQHSDFKVKHAELSSSVERKRASLVEASRLVPDLAQIPKEELERISALAERIQSLPYSSTRAELTRFIKDEARKHLVVVK